jgi:cyclopropane-fatty-acyl-phospholipid synthase
MLHTIVRPAFKEARAKGLPLTHEVVHFTQFILAEIFPGGWLPTPHLVEEHASDAGFKLSRVQSLQLHYARTLDLWAAALEANKDKAIEIQSQKVYDRYMKYLTGCAKLFREGYTDVDQFTLVK